MNPKLIAFVDTIVYLRLQREFGNASRYEGEQSLNPAAGAVNATADPRIGEFSRFNHQKPLSGSHSKVIGAVRRVSRGPEAVTSSDLLTPGDAIT